MKAKGKMLASGLVVLMLLLVFGFAFHVSPRFAGSFWGGVLGILGALLMLFPLLYMVIKRIKWLKKRLTKHVSMKTLLAWHVYAGIVGPILVVLHSGHKFQSPLGVALMTLTIVVVLSGFVGRYLMNQFSMEIRQKKAMLTELQAAYSRAQVELATHPTQARALRPFAGLITRVIGGFFFASEKATSPAVATPATLLRVTESMADVEYAIATHERFRAWFGKWLKIHIVISFALYGLMGLHIWGAIHFGLRWVESWAPSTLNRAAAASTSPIGQEVFARHFGRVFARYWRPAVRINGTKTTVFDYLALATAAKDARSDFARAENALRRVNLEQFKTGNEAKAFWLNVYNFGAMKIAADHYPIDSITDPKVTTTGDPWGIKFLKVGKQHYALRQIEKDILLARFKDPRIVFAVSCAAVSCPDRTATIFNKDILDKQLDDLIRVLLKNADKGLKVDPEDHVLTLSWIFKADHKLFGGGDKDGLLNFLAPYAPPDVHTWIQRNRHRIRIDYFDHDWTLNDSSKAI